MFRLNLTYPAATQIKDLPKQKAKDCKELLQEVAECDGNHGDAFPVDETGIKRIEKSGLRVVYRADRGEIRVFLIQSVR